MKTPLLSLCAAACLLLFGCTSRSISDSGYPGGYGHRESNGYRGELSEFDVLGVDTTGNISEADIAAAMTSSKSVRLSRASKLLLIQSGADFPDSPMADALNARYTVGPFSGKPRDKDEPSTSYSKSLRLAAAQGGYDKILCYWGVLESQSTDQATKGVSWIPIVGYFVPDESQSMRIRLKGVLIDTLTGKWVMVQPEPVTDKQLSSIVSRGKSDQELVGRLKEAGYKSMASLLSNGFTD